MFGDGKMVTVFKVLLQLHAVANYCTKTKKGDKYIYI